MSQVLGENQHHKRVEVPQDKVIKGHLKEKKVVLLMDQEKEIYQRKLTLK